MRNNRIASLVAAFAASCATLAGVALLMYFAVPWPKHLPSASDLTSDQQTESPQATGPADPTVASITPAGTDLVLGIGAANHLVAISDYDEDRDGTEDLPRVGDFDHVDWEKLAFVGPKILLTQFGSRMPPQIQQRCEQMGIRVIDVRLDSIQDVYDQSDRLGKVLGVVSSESAAVASLKRRLADISAQAARYPPVRAAIALSDGGTVGLIGAGSVHDQLLAIAGGINVAAPFKKPYISVDREQLMSLAPDVVLDLEPCPPGTPQQLRQAARFWGSTPDLAAVRTHRVYTITVPFCLRPGWRLADLAEIFSRQLHPQIR